MSIEELLILQEQGAKACREGIPDYDNPFLDTEVISPPNREGWADWVIKHDAWKFGWNTEKASMDGKLLVFDPRRRISAR
jgi:hypothetical protein